MKKFMMNEGENMTRIRQVRLTNYTTQRTIYKEITPEQHKKLLEEIANKNKQIETELIKEREL